MVKKSKMRTKKRYQRGGSWLNPTTWFQSDPNAPKKSWGEWFTETSSSTGQGVKGALGTVEGGLNSALNTTKSGFNTALSSVGLASETTTPPIQAQPEVNQVNMSNPDNMTNPNNMPIQDNMTNPDNISQNNNQNFDSLQRGGKRGRRGKQTRRGKRGGGLGLTYYATPVQNLRVAEPTYWEVYGKGNIMRAGSKKRHNKRARKVRKTRKH